MMRQLIVLLMIQAGTVGCFPVVVTPADGGPNLLDRTFGVAGVARTAFDCAAHAHANAIIAVGDGGLLAGGYACNGWAVAGFRSDGSLDPSWGDAGMVTLFSDAGYYEVRTLLARPDGRVLARGATPQGYRVRQFTAGGGLDSSFNTAVDLALSGHDRIQAIALQPDGKLLVGDGTLLRRVSSDGTLDLTFGSGGSLDVTLFGAETFLSGLLVQADGSIVISGLYTGGPNRYGEPFIAQLTPSGTLDARFGTGGVVKIRADVGGTTFSLATALQRDGKVIVAGSTTASSLAHSRPVVWRLTTDGVLDPSFGAAGKAEAPAGGGDCLLNAVAVLADGKIVAAGSYRRLDEPAEAWQVVRFTQVGQLDETFGNTGSTVFAPGDRLYSPGGAEALAITPAGYVVAGRLFLDSGPGTFGLARVLP